VAVIECGSLAARAGIRSLLEMAGQTAVSSPEQVVAKVQQAVAEKRSS
jgi:hypothetical protein